jgi:hypothetical protein
MKVKIFSFFVVISILSYAVFLARKQDQTSTESTQALAKNIVEKEIKEEVKSSLIPLPSSTKDSSLSKQKASSFVSHEEQKITRETERDFLTLKIPETFPSSQEERYQQIYSIYLISTFYLNKVAAGNLTTNKDHLTKALKGLALYFHEMESTYQPDSALTLIESNTPSLFQESLQDLSLNEKTLIEEALKIQAEE